jgi:hypothetical protein
VGTLTNSLEESEQGISEELTLGDLQLLFNLSARDSASRLTLQTTDLASYLFNNIIKTHHLRVGVIDSLRYRVHVLTEASDVRGLLDHDTTVIGLSGDDTTDLSLRDDRVSSRGEAHNAKELFDVLETARNFIKEKLGLAASIESTSNLHLTHRLKP